MNQVWQNLTEIINQWMVDVLTLLPQIIIGIIIFILSLYLARLVARLLKKTLERSNTDAEVVILLSRVVRWGVIGLGILLAFQQAGTDITAFLTGLGILGFTIGFALQDVSSNFMAGMLLLIQQPFDIGDAIEVNGHTGVVREISLRDTEILSLDGVPIRIPNNDVFTNAITNYSRSNRRRFELGIGVAYDTDLEQAKALAEETIGKIEGILSDPAPQAIFHTFGASSIEATIYYWADMDELEYWHAQDIPLREIKRAFEAAGIELPFPMRTVMVQQQ